MPDPERSVVARVGSCLRRNDEGGRRNDGREANVPGARGVAGVKRVGCWARRDTRGKRGYDGVGSRSGEGSVGGEGGAYAAVG